MRPIQLDLRPVAIDAGVAYGSWGSRAYGIEFLDLFCGGGGSGSGILRAFEEFREPVRGTFVNHAWEAIRVHITNHPGHRHFCTGVDNVSPEALYGHQHPFFLWASPACTQHSFAHGGAPINEQSRSTATCIIRWLRKVRPVHAIIENVPEFLLWGDTIQKRDARSGRAIWLAKLASVRQYRPAAFRGVRAEEVEIDWVPFVRNFNESQPEYRERLAAAGFQPFMIPDVRKRSNRYRAWLRKVQREGYMVEARVLQSCSYGDPTSRQRLFINCVRIDSGRKIIWPSATHAAPAEDGLTPAGLRPYRTAFDSVIDWRKPSSSIFARTIPYRDNTMRRMGIGMARYSLRRLAEAASVAHAREALEAIEPFILPQQQGGRSVKSVHEPVSTVTTTMRGERIVTVTATPVGMDPAGPRMCAALAKSFASRGRAEKFSTLRLTRVSAGAKGPVARLFSETFPRNPHVSFWECSFRCGRLTHRYPVIQCGKSFYLIDLLTRVIDWTELSKAQGFPPDYKWVGNPSDIIKAIGNSVTCGVSYALTKAALSQNPDITARVGKGPLSLVS